MMGRFSGKSLMLSLAVPGGKMAIHERSIAQGSADPVLDRQLDMQQLEKDSKVMSMILARVKERFVAKLTINGQIFVVDMTT